MFYRYMTFEHSFFRKAHVLFIGQSFSVFCIILTLKEKKLFATTQTCTNKYAVEKSIFVFFAKFNLVIFFSRFVCSENCIFVFLKVLLTSTRNLVGKSNANSLRSVTMTIGGAIKFRTDRIKTNKTKQMPATYRAGANSGPTKRENKNSISFKKIFVQRKKEQFLE